MLTLSLISNPSDCGTRCEKEVFFPHRLKEVRQPAEKEGDYCKTRIKMCPGDKTQPFHATVHQLALQNIVPSFSFKASHNNIFMHMLTHFKKWGQININWLSFLNFKSDGQVWAFYFKIPSLPRPGGAWFSWSTTHPVSRRSLLAVTQNSQPELWVTLESTGCTMPNAMCIQCSSSNPDQLVSFSTVCFWARKLAHHTIQQAYLVLQSVASRELSSSFCWSTDTQKRTVSF